MNQTSVTARLAGALLAVSLAGTAAAAVREDAVSYQQGDTVLKGFVVYDDAHRVLRPGIVVVPTWWGVNQHMRDEAQQYARAGYTAFVADMIGEGRNPDSPKEAGPLMMSLRTNPALMLSRFNAAKDQLAKHMTVDASRIGAAGYSGDGAFALDAARAGSELRGVAVFYVSMLGTALTPAHGAKIRSKMLILNGGAIP